MSVSMPSIEVGTVGGGTVLEPQGAMLDLIGVRGSNDGQNAIGLAKAVAAGVLAGELSLCSALTVGALVESRKCPPSRPTEAAVANIVPDMNHNRK